jgi:hypothetical protein
MLKNFFEVNSTSTAELGRINNELTLKSIHVMLAGYASEAQKIYNVTNVSGETETFRQSKPPNPPKPVETCRNFRNFRTSENLHNSYQLTQIVICPKSTIGPNYRPIFIMP